jgi:hypothetical protein
MTVLCFKSVALREVPGQQHGTQNSIRGFPGSTMFLIYVSCHAPSLKLVVQYVILPYIENAGMLKLASSLLTVVV